MKYGGQVTSAMNEGTCAKLLCTTARAPPEGRFYKTAPAHCSTPLSLVFT